MIHLETRADMIEIAMQWIVDQELEVTERALKKENPDPFAEFIIIPFKKKNKEKIYTQLKRKCYAEFLSIVRDIRDRKKLAMEEALSVIREHRANQQSSMCK